MTVSNLLLPNFSNFNRFRNLALFVCHLFVDGNFRVGNILYDPKAVNSEIISEIHSFCPLTDPWLMIDATQLPIDSWKPDERADKILQLIFFDPDQVQVNHDGLKDILVLYRLFVFPSIDEAKKDHQMMVKITSRFGSNSLVVHFSTESVSVYALWVESASDGDSDNEVNLIQWKISIELIFELKANTDLEKDNLFDRIFEKYEQNYVKATSVKSEVKQNELKIVNGVPLLGEFYFSNRNFKPTTGKIYRGISKEYQPIGPRSM